MRQFLSMVAAAGLLVGMVACGGDGEDPPKVDTLRDVLLAVIEVGCEKADECGKLPSGTTLEDCLGGAESIEQICSNTMFPIDCNAMLNEQQRADAQKCLQESADLSCDAQGLPDACPDLPAPQPEGT